MKLWIVIWSHRCGLSAWPRYAKESPSEFEEIEELCKDYQWGGEEDGDYLDIEGPFDLPVTPDTGISIAIEALQAIWARIQGEFDHPALVKFGPLGMLDGDIGTISSEALAKLERSAPEAHLVFTSDTDTLTDYKGQLEACVEQMEQCEKMFRDDESFMEVLNDARELLDR